MNRHPIWLTHLYYIPQRMSINEMPIKTDIHTYIWYMGSKRETTKSENARGSETSRQICLMCVRAPNSRRLSKLVTHTQKYLSDRQSDGRTDCMADTQLEIWRSSICCLRKPWCASWLFKQAWQRAQAFAHLVATRCNIPFIQLNTYSYATIL